VPKSTTHLELTLEDSRYMHDVTFFCKLPGKKQKNQPGIEPTDASRFFTGLTLKWVPPMGQKPNPARPLRIPNQNAVFVLVLSTRI